MPGARQFSLESTEKIFLVDAVAVSMSVGEPALLDAGLSTGKTTTVAGKQVWGLNERELNHVLRRLDLVVIERYGHTKPNVEWLSVIRADRLSGRPRDLARTSRMLRYPFQIDAWQGDDRYGFAVLFSRILGPCVGRKIVLSVPHANYRAYESRGAFNVCIWSTPFPANSRNQWVPESIWGHPVDCRDTAFGGYKHDALKGLSICDGEYVVAQIFPNGLYVHHDLVEVKSESSLAITEELCKRAAAVLKDRPRMEAAIRKEEEEYAAWQRRAFQEFVMKRIPDRAHQHDEVLEDAKKRAREARRDFFEARRRVFLLEQARIDSAAVSTRLQDEMEKLQRGGVQHLTAVGMRPYGNRSVLCGYTDVIIATDSETDDQYMLGRYRIELDFDGEEVRFFNLDRLVEETHGPHVSSDGTVCFGNLEDEIYDLLAGYEAEALFTIAIAFLQHPNVGDSEGVRVRQYPVFRRGTTDTEGEETSDETD